MTESAVLISHLAAFLIVIALTGLVARGRARLCWSFLGYLIAILAGNRLVTHFPEQFHTHWFWTVKSIAYTVLVAMTAFEIGWRTFASFPVARRRAMLTMSLVTMGTVATVAAGAAPGGYLAVLGILTPRGEAGTLWLFALVVGFAGWHRIPIHPFHRTLLLGFGLYLAVYTGLLSLVGLKASGGYLVAHAFLAALDPLAISATIGLWSIAAWRPVREGPEIIRTLHPWATSWS